MAVNDGLEPDPQVPEIKTLGDVLYARPGPLVSEESWVTLVRSVAAGDQVALHALYERANRPVFTLIFRMIGNRETAEEVTVDVFHDVWRRAATYDVANGTVLGWIMNQARSRGIDRQRFDQRKKRVDPSTGEAPASSAPADAHALLESKEAGRSLQEALTTLSPGEREAIETAYFSGLTYSEAAARLDQPVGTVKTRIRSGLEKLRTALEAGETKR